jgi:hypothetical protein
MVSCTTSQSKALRPEFGWIGGQMPTDLITFANFVCRAGIDGEAQVLLDLAVDIVIPAFMNVNYVRKYGDTQYLFRDNQSF